MNETGSLKAKHIVADAGKSRFRKYRELFYGDCSTAFVLKAELIAAFACSAPGAYGIFLRSRLYPGLFRSCGKGSFFGRNLTLRHTRKIEVGSGVVVDDNCVLDAKGSGNRIAIEDNVFIGRNTLIYCKGGNIRIGKGASISSNCTIFSSNDLVVGEGTLVGGYCYLLSGGEYDLADAGVPFAEQSGMKSAGPLTIGGNCWLGARVAVLDAACIGDHCVVGAGAVVTKPLPPNSLAVGVPARVVRSL